MHTGFTFTIKNRRLFAAVCGAFIGAAVFLLIFTSVPLNVSDDSWILRGYVERDIIQHYTGWLQYREAAAIFPFGIAKNLNPPVGAAIAFSDSVPIMAILMRPVSMLFQDTFQYFGIYNLLCYILTGIAASLLLELFINGMWSLLLGTVLFTLSPVMLERAFRHTALASHFLLLFAFWLYFKNQKEGFRLRFGFLVLSVLSPMIHFYFVPMLLAILFADLLQHYLNTKEWKRTLLFLAGNIVLVLSSAFFIGYFHTPTQQSGTGIGFGYFTMNLNSLFNPRSVSGIKWSTVLPQLGQGLGSAEGFNYLGLGVLLILLSAAFFCTAKKNRKPTIYIAKRHCALLLVSAVLSIFAISSTIVINNNAYLRIPLPMRILTLFSLFRSSGRLFWPVNYLLLLFSIIFLNRFLGKFSKKRLASAGMALLCVVQLLDLLPAFTTKHRSFTSPEPGFENMTDNVFFEKNKNAFSEIVTFSDSGVTMGIYLAHFSATHNIKINEPFLARNDLATYHAHGDAEYQKLMQGEIDPQKLYVFDDQNRFFNAAMALKDSAFTGIVADTYYVLFGKASSGHVPDDPIFLPLAEIPLMLPNYTDGTWEKGVLVSSPQIVTFYDNAFTKQYLDNAEYIIADGTRYKILEKDYKDAGWVMIQLDISDGSVLIDRMLTVE